MKKIKFLLLFLILQTLLINSVLAENGIEIKVIDGTFSIRGYTTDPVYGRVDFGIFDKIVNASLGETFSCNNFTIGNNTYQDNCTLDINYNKDIILLTQNESSTTILGDTALLEKLNVCLSEKATCWAGYNTNLVNQQTQSNYEKNYTQCSVDIQICRSDKANADSKISELKEELDSLQNRWIFTGILGLVLGIGGYAYKEGKIWGPKAKREDENYNKRQAM